MEILFQSRTSFISALFSDFSWFPEYQYFVTHAIPTLTRVDDWDITEATRATVARFPLRSLDEYDQVFSQRQLFADMGHSSARSSTPHRNQTLM